jgi:hypothetical protein
MSTTTTTATTTTTNTDANIISSSSSSMTPMSSEAMLSSHPFEMDPWRQVLPIDVTMLPNHDESNVIDNTTTGSTHYHSTMLTTCATTTIGSRDHLPNDLPTDSLSTLSTQTTVNTRPLSGSFPLTDSTHPTLPLHDTSPIENSFDLSSISIPSTSYTVATSTATTATTTTATTTHATSASVANNTNNNNNSATRHTSQTYRPSTHGLSILQTTILNTRQTRYILMVDSVVWEADQNASTCRNCDRRFSIWLRRHHCR